MMDESLVLFIYQISSVIAAIVFNFNKILTLENDNKLLFYSLNRIFALSPDFITFLRHHIAQIENQ